MLLILSISFIISNQVVLEYYAFVQSHRGWVSEWVSERVSEWVSEQASERASESDNVIVSD